MGVQVDVLGKQVGLDISQLNDPVARVDEAIMLSLFDLIVTQTSTPDFGLIMGQQARPGTYSAVGYAVMNCASLGEALPLIPRYEGVVMELGETQLQVSSEQVKLIWGAHGGKPVPRALIDTIFSSWLFLAHWLTGDSIRPSRTLLSYAEPADTQLHQKLFDNDVQFSCSENAFVFSGVSILNKNILQADAEMSHIMQQRAKALSERLGSQSPTYRVVMASLQKKLHLGLVSLAEITADIALSERTVRRRLAGEGYSYQEMLTRLRRELACKYLLDVKLSILDIALLLGYKEHSSFTAAFKIWQGITPLQYRNKRLRS